MKWWTRELTNICIGLFFLMPFSAVSAATQYQPTDFVTYHARVLLPNHEPASNTTVTLRSMSRNMLRGFSGYNIEPVVTDADGRADLKFASRVRSAKGKNYGFPVFPIYAVVDPAGDHAGAIIRLDAVAPLEPLIIQLPSGYTLHGKMETEDGDPISSFPVFINHDLHAKTHTGRGGEIWERQTLTDLDGRFTFRHVNPAPITITPKWLRESYWSQTVLNGTTIDDRADEFQPEWNNTDHYMVIKTSPSPAKSYRGIAIDTDGNPVANASVTIGYSCYSSHDNGRSYVTTRTLSDGSWHLEIPTKWANWGGIRQAGAPGPTTGTAHIAASGKIDLGITAEQVVRLLPVDSDALMPFSH